MDYYQLLRHTQDNISQANFAQLRAAYSQWENYDPYAKRYGDQELAALMGAQKWEAAEAIAREMLTQDFLNISVHLSVAAVYMQINQPARAQHHLQFAGGLLRSIFDSGDGRNFQTAFKVIHIREIYDVVNVLKLRVSTQRLMTHDDRQRYDVLNVVNTQGNTGVIYFNVEMLVAYLDSRAVGSFVS